MLGPEPDLVHGVDLAGTGRVAEDEPDRVQSRDDDSCAQDLATASLDEPHSSPALNCMRSYNQLGQQGIAKALHEAASSFDRLPAIFRRRRPGGRDIEEVLGVQVADWSQVKRCSHSIPPRRHAISKLQDIPYTARQAVHKNAKGTKRKGSGSGRTYTSKYRGVHQTFPTKRWEAQFRRNGKPTSLGCFDLEQEAAKAYDKMMLWCELHQVIGVKGGITNFDPSEYERDLAYLQSVSQEELVQAMRSEGRKQATHRIMRQKRDGQLTYALMSELDTIVNVKAPV